MNVEGASGPPRSLLEPALAAARRVCALLEGASALDRDAFDERLEALESALVTVVYEVHRLPLVEPASEDPLADLPPAVARRYTGLDLFRRFPSWDPASQPWAADRPLELLMDDLGDLWRDLKGVVVAADDPAVPIADVAWALRFGFDSHWGPHALAALPSIHYMNRH